MQQWKLQGHFVFISYLFRGRYVVQNGVDGLFRVVPGDGTSNVSEELLVPVHHLWKVGLQGVETDNTTLL